MDGEEDLFQGFNRLANRILDERDRRAVEGASGVDTAYDLLALILQHYHEEYRVQIDGGDLLEGTLGPYPFGEAESSVPLERVKKWLLLQCDKEREFLPRRIIDVLRGEYLTFLWRYFERMEVVSPPTRGVGKGGKVTDAEKVRSILLCLGFGEPYQPKWGFRYICSEFERARDTLLTQADVECIDAETVRVVRDNAILVWKGYKRLLKMLLSFYSQYAFGDALALVTELKTNVRQPRRYLESRSLGELVELVDKFSWKEFSETIVLKRGLIDNLQRLCAEIKEPLKLSTGAAFKPEEIPPISQYVLRRMVAHLLDLQEEYRAAFPLVVALKAYRQDEDGRVRIDYLDENGEWGILRKDIAFQPQRDFYLFRRSGRSPVVIPVEGRHQDFIIRNDLPIRKQMDDAELRTLFDKFERCRKILKRSGAQRVIFMAPPVASPLEKLGIPLAGRVDRDRLFETVQQGETDMIEFKATCRDPSRSGEVDRGKIAQEMTALANTKGGILIFGIPDKDKPKDIERAREMREELGASREKQEQMGERWGLKYILDIIAGVAKGSSRDAHACWPAVTCAPQVFDAVDLELEEGKVLVVAVFPMGENQLCRVSQLVYVRVGTSCRVADDPWVDEWYRSKKKMWL